MRINCIHLTVPDFSLAVCQQLLVPLAAQLLLVSVKTNKQNTLMQKYW